MRKRILIGATAASILLYSSLSAASTAAYILGTSTKSRHNHNNVDFSPVLGVYNDGFVDVKKFYRDGPSFRVCNKDKTVRAIGKTKNGALKYACVTYSTGLVTRKIETSGEGQTLQEYLDTFFGQDEVVFKGVSTNLSGTSLRIFYRIKEDPLSTTDITPVADGFLFVDDVSYGQDGQLSLCSKKHCLPATVYLNQELKLDPGSVGFLSVMPRGDKYDKAIAFYSTDTAVEPINDGYLVSRYLSGKEHDPEREACSKDSKSSFGFQCLPPQTLINQQLGQGKASFVALHQSKLGYGTILYRRNTP